MMIIIISVERTSSNIASFAMLLQFFLERKNGKGSPLTPNFLVKPSNFGKVIVLQ